MSVPFSSYAPGQSPLPGAFILCVRIPGEEPISYDVGIKVIRLSSAMSALPPKADIRQLNWNVSLGLIADFFTKVVVGEDFRGG
jgi:hypothetical protein